MASMRLVLASASPRRAELLANAGIRYEIRPANIPEARLPEESADTYVQRLAAAKAGAVTASEGEIVLGADTTVVVGGEVLEKPDGPADARRMLELLSGRTHEVITGICLRRGGARCIAAETTLVSFLEMTSADIDEYIASGEPFDKAGGYAIQGRASKFVHRIEGCYFNVVGLPVSRVWRMLRELTGGGGR
jgi:septum formation protein